MPDASRDRLRKNRMDSLPVIRGDIPVVEHAYGVLIQNFVVSIFITVFTCFGLAAIYGLFGYRGDAIWPFFLTSMLTVSLFLFWPLYVIAWHRYRKNEKPADTIFRKFLSLQQWLKKHAIKHDLITVTEPPENEHKTRLLEDQRRQKIRNPEGFSLWLGKSTGLFADLWHRAGMAGQQQVSLDLEDTCQNILVLGGIGSGKTTCVMQPLLLQCLDQGCGGLVFDIKGDVKNAVRQFASATGRELVVMGPGHQRINLIEGLTPEIAASFLKSALLLGNRGNTDSFWVDTASELCRNTLGILSFFPEHYSLQGLHQYLFELDTQESIHQLVDALLKTLPDREARLLKTYCNYHELIFAHFDARIRSGVNASIAQALAPFSHPDLMDAFCSSTPSLTHMDRMDRMEDILQGTVYLVDIPLSIWGLGGKVAYTFIKLRFFNLMQNRNNWNNGQEKGKKNSGKPVFFMCDEYQEIVSASRDGLSDLNFWDKSRSSKTIGIISSQSIASFHAALGSHDLANALLQNFRQKLCLRTEDPVTLDFMERLTGRARVKKVSESQGNNHYSKTISESREGVVDAQMFRELRPGQAVAILSLAGHAMDDVLVLEPVYTN